jgi:hypothetical protein
VVNWKKGKVHTKNGKKVRYIYPNGKKRGKKLVSASGRRKTNRRSYSKRRY